MSTREGVESTAMIEVDEGGKKRVRWGAVTEHAMYEVWACCRKPLGAIFGGEEEWEGGTNVVGLGSVTRNHFDLV